MKTITLARSQLSRGGSRVSELITPRSNMVTAIPRTAGLSTKAPEVVYIPNAIDRAPVLA